MKNIIENSNLVELKQEELKEIDGGIIPFLIYAGAVVVGGAVGGAAAYVGYKLAEWLDN